MNSLLQAFRKAMLRKGYSVVRASVMDKLWLQSESDSAEFEVVVELYKGTLRVRVNGKIVQSVRAAAVWIKTVGVKGIKFVCVQSVAIGRMAASALHALLGGSGISDHYALAEAALGRPVRSFTDLSPEEEHTIRQYMITAFRGVA